jgi:tetratricopeptide (TPR) repeat protein
MWLAGIAATLVVTGARAQPASIQKAERNAEHAAALYESGKQALASSEYQRALDFFRSARQAQPSAKHTLGVAKCLYELKRYDEALEMYDELVKAFGGHISEITRESAVDRMSKLQKQLGRIALSANVNGEVIVDGRARASLPLWNPLSILPGRHRLRILKEGYEAFERDIWVARGETITLDARLNVIGRGGRLRVDGDTKLHGGDLYVDKAIVGQIPWEGSLAPGRHVIHVRADEMGSAPESVEIGERRVTRMRVSARQLGKEVRLVPPTATAELAIDGVRVGKGAWRGRLPIGKHIIEIADDRRQADVQTLLIRADTQQERFSVVMETGALGSRWKTTRHKGPWLDVFFGNAIAPSMRSSAESSCTRGRCSFARGLHAGALLSFEPRRSFSVHAGLGLLYLEKGAIRHLEEGYGAFEVATYDVRDQVRFYGPFISAGAGYHIAWSHTIGTALRAHVMTVMAFVRDNISAEASSSDTHALASVQRAGQLKSGFALMTTPEIQMTFRRGHLRAAIGTAVGLQLLRGPLNDHGELIVDRGDVACTTHPAPVQCAKGVNKLARERTYDPFIVWLPSLSLGYQF